MADPREGTMYGDPRDPRRGRGQGRRAGARELPRDVAEAEQDAMLAELMVTAIAAGQEALERTPEQLDVLAEAGVVDAGAYGLLVILAGLVAGLTGQEAGDSPVPHQTASPAEGVIHFDSRFRYCTSCIVTGRDLDPRGRSPRGSRSSATRSRSSRLDDAQGPRPPPTRPGGRARSAPSTATCTSSSSPTCGDRSPSATSGSRGRGSVDECRRCGLRRRHRRALRRRGRARGGWRGRRSSLDHRDPRGHPGDPRRGGDRAAQLLERDPRRGGGRAARRPPRAGGRLDLAAGGPGGARRRPRPRRERDENAARMEAELEVSATGWWRRPTATIPAAVIAAVCGRLHRQGPGRLGRPHRTLRAVVDALARDAEIVTVLEGADAPSRAGELDLGPENGAELEIHDGGQPTYWWLVAAQ